MPTASDSNLLKVLGLRSPGGHTCICMGGPAPYRKSLLLRSIAIRVRTGDYPEIRWEARVLGGKLESINRDRLDLPTEFRLQREAAGCRALRPTHLGSLKTSATDRPAQAVQ